MARELAKSSSNLNDIVYSGRPRNEEPHVKKTTKKKSEKIEYIVRVDLDELKIDDEEFDDLQSLYQLFDLDKDGILNFKEYEKLLRCLGYRLGEEQARLLASSVSVDKSHYSVSFNEFLKLISMQQASEPDEETLVEMFASFDKEDVGMIPESLIRQLMSSKDDINEEDIREMLEEYFRLAQIKGIKTGRPDGVPQKAPETPPPGVSKNRRSSKAPSRKSVVSGGDDASQLSNSKDEERWIDYREFAAMLQQ